MSKSRYPIPSETIKAYCRVMKQMALRFLGSVLRDDFHSGSDIDIRVNFGEESIIGQMGMMRVQNEFAHILGRVVGLRTVEEISPYFRDRLLGVAETLYVRG